jgi:hypothetical protein
MKEKYTDTGEFEGIEVSKSEFIIALFFTICVVIFFCYLFMSVKPSTAKEEANATNISEEAVHSDGISVECPYCGKRAKLVLEIDEK